MRAQPLGLQSGGRELLESWTRGTRIEGRCPQLRRLRSAATERVCGAVRSSPSYGLDDHAAHVRPRPVSNKVSTSPPASGQLYGSEPQHRCHSPTCPPSSTGASTSVGRAVLTLMLPLCKQGFLRGRLSFRLSSGRPGAFVSAQKPPIHAHTTARRRSRTGACGVGKRVGFTPRGFESRILRCADQGKQSPKDLEAIERVDPSSQFRPSCSFACVPPRPLAYLTSPKSLPSHGDA